MPAISIVLADPHFVTRAGIRDVIMQIIDFELILEVKDSEELIKAVTLQHPNVLIIDYNLGLFQLEDLTKVKQLSPQTNILVISSDQNKNNIYKVLDFGVKNFITKECDSDEIIKAVYATAKGEKFFCEKVVDIILEKHFSIQNDQKEPSQLSQRETEIVQLIAEGYTGKEIAEKLFLSHHTVSTHRKNILKKLQVNSASELILYAIRLGIIPPPKK